MRRILICLALLAVSAIPATAANLKLYLKDGGYQLVREYQVQQDRVRFYSVERSQWEEIPLELVDLKRTQTEASAREEKLAKDAKSLTQEEEERKALQKEVMRIPQDPGAYWLDKDNLHIMTAAESTMHTNKGRSALRVLTGVPMLSGKGTVEIQGGHSTNVFTDPQQEFYIQVSETEPYGIIRLTPKNGVRIAENLTMEPMTKQVDEEIDTVDIVIQEMAKGGLYKIWAEKPLPPGEYAVVEYTLGKLNMQIWDFAIKAK